MQKIYTTGAGRIEPGEQWLEIKKPENFRCSQAVQKVINAIRREDDQLIQTGGRTEIVDDETIPVEGSARLCIVPADDNRLARLTEVKKWLSHANADLVWDSDQNEGVRVLVLVHRMAAIRLGFEQLYAALNDNGDNRLKDGLLDGSAWVLRPFLTSILPLVRAMSDGKQFDALDRQHKQNGTDSVIDRTRRLFYVCCSRARRDLAVVFFTSDVEAAVSAIKQRRFFDDEDIIGFN
jgi:DNA helicase II / ATP-dependent DNA helicase PcrA